MNRNLKRKLLAGLFVPVLGLSVGTALAQSSSGTSGAGTGAAGAGTSAGATGSSSTGAGMAGSTGATGSTSTGAGVSGSAGVAGGSNQSGTSGGQTTSTSGSWNAQTFDRLDANHDGILSREEAMSDPVLRDQWSKLDSKSTGKVSKSDFERFRTTQGNLGSSTTSKSSTEANAMSGSTGTTSSPKK